MRRLGKRRSKPFGPWSMRTSVYTVQGLAAPAKGSFNVPNHPACVAVHRRAAAAKVDPKAAVEGDCRRPRLLRTRPARPLTRLRAFRRCLTQTSSCPRPRAMPSAAMPLSPCSAKTRPTRRARSASPIRGGISADGTQGFTYGFLSLTSGDPTRRDRKYLAYWIKQPAGWRVVAYRQQVRQPGEVSKQMLPPSLPPFAAEPVTDPAAMAILHLSVAAAESPFPTMRKRSAWKRAFRDYGRKMR